MDDTFVVKSNGQNNYLVSRNIPQILLAHPYLEYLLELEKSGTNLSEWLNRGDNLEFTISGTNGSVKASKRELSYYYKYYLFLKSNNFFKKAQKEPMNCKRYTPKAIKYFFANSYKITFEVTDACNLKCRYCGYGDLYKGFDKRSSKKLSIKTARNLLDYFYKFRESTLDRKMFKKMVIGYYGGEPLLNFPFIKTITAYAREKFVKNGVRFDITTNGVLLDKYMDFLVENDFYLRISLDGNQAHNSYRIFMDGAPAFPIVYRNAQLLQRRYPDYFEKNVRFIAVSHKRNSLEDIHTFFKVNFNKKPLISDISLVGVNPEKSEDFYEIYKAYVALKDSEPDNIHEKRNDHGKEAKYPVRFDVRGVLFSHTYYIIQKYSQLLRESENCISVQTGTCDPFKKKIFLTVNGKILPCERIPQNYFLGEVTEKEVRIDFEKISDKYTEWYGKLSEMCNRCFNGHYCDQCIFHLGFEGKTCQCNRFKNIRSYKKKLAQSISLLEDNPLLYSEIMNE